MARRNEDVTANPADADENGGGTAPTMRMSARSKSVSLTQHER